MSPSSPATAPSSPPRAIFDPSSCLPDGPRSALRPLHRSVEEFKLSFRLRPFHHFLLVLVSTVSQSQSGNQDEGEGRGWRRQLKWADLSLPKEIKCRLASVMCLLKIFLKTWLRLKELHAREPCRLQGKVTSLRKERLSDGRWTGSISRIKDLTEQRRALNDTICDLRGQLNAKVCDRSTVNKTYRNMLQQKFYDIQQQNLKFIGELPAERNKLREENKQLLARLKRKQPVSPFFFS